VRTAPATQADGETRVPALHVLFYESVADVAERAPLYFEAHQARWREFAGRGELLMVGPFSDRSGAMAVFTTQKAAEHFAQGDPLVLHGLVRSWQVRTWLEAITPTPDPPTPSV
jgi:uncharacterized protein YciI